MLAQFGRGAQAVAQHARDGSLGKIDLAELRMIQRG